MGEKAGLGSPDSSDKRVVPTLFLRAMWRTTWRNLAVIALMLTLTGGLSIAALASARRSATSFDRFQASAQTHDVFVSYEGPETPELAALMDGPLVEAHRDLTFVFVDVDSVGYVFAATSPEAQQVEQGVLLSGRRANPNDPLEVVVAETNAKRFGLEPGDVWKVATISTEQTEALINEGIEPTSLEGPEVQLRVVGVSRNGFDLGREDEDPAITFLTPAFLERYGEEVGTNASSRIVRLADSTSAAEFNDAILQASEGGIPPSLSPNQSEILVSGAIAVIAAAFAAIAGVIAAAGLVWVGSAIVRQQRSVSRELEVVRVLGATSSDRRWLLLGVVAPGVIAGILLAPVLAVVLSPWFQVGVAKVLEPNPGRHVDLTAVAAGMAVMLVTIGATSLISATRLSGLRVDRGKASARSGRRLDRVIQRLSPAPGTGVRFALVVPRDVSIPVRPALLGACVGVLGLTTVAVVGASLQRLVDTPSRWGAPWDVTVEQSEDLQQQILENPDIAGAAIGHFDDQVAVDGRTTYTVSITPLKGDMTTTIVAGRAPRSGSEIALGRDTLNELGLSLGDTVEVKSRSQMRGQFKVVGVAAFPTIDDPSLLAEGAAFSGAGSERLGLGDPERDDSGFSRLLIAWAPGIDHDAAIEQLGQPSESLSLPVAPAEVRGLEEVEGFPRIAAGALVVLGLIATSHALIVTVQRRRKELGILTALGFVPRQRGLVSLVQAVTIAGLALLIGIPLGAVAGRATWRLMVQPLGVATDPITPVALLATGSVALLGLFGLLGLFPARYAARIRAGEALRAE